MYYLLFVQIDELGLDATERRFAQCWIDIDIHCIHQSISIARNARGKRVLDLLQAFEAVLTRGFDGLQWIGDGIAVSLVTVEEIPAISKARAKIVAA